MFCTNCGKEIDDKAVICVHCGVPTHNMMISQSVVNARQQEQSNKSINGYGLAGFVVGLVSIWLGVLFCIPSITGLVFSIVGMVKGKNYRLNGFAVAGLVISICATVLWGAAWFDIMFGGGGAVFYY